MSKIIFITGGAISGKSTFALKTLKDEKDVVFVATGQACDKEMEEKIENHKKERSEDWKTIEVGDSNLEEIIKKVDREFVIIDCLTFYVSTQLIKNKNNILNSVEKAIKEIKSNKKIKKCIVVSNEVGMGIVPNNELSRNFREMLGGANKIFMKNADEAYFMVSGHPLKLK